MYDSKQHLIQLSVFTNLSQTKTERIELNTLKIVDISALNGYRSNKDLRMGEVARKLWKIRHPFWSKFWTPCSYRTSEWYTSQWHKAHVRVMYDSSTYLKIYCTSRQAAIDLREQLIQHIFKENNYLTRKIDEPQLLQE